jgi:hypothetical protein
MARDMQWEIDGLWDQLAERDKVIESLASKLADATEQKTRLAIALGKELADGDELRALLRFWMPASEFALKGLDKENSSL